MKHEITIKENSQIKLDQSVLVRHEHGLLAWGQGSKCFYQITTLCIGEDSITTLCIGEDSSNCWTLPSQLGKRFSCKQHTCLEFQQTNLKLCCLYWPVQ